MQQFAELMASQAVKDYAQQEAHRAAREASGQKAAGPKAPARHLHGKPPPGYSLPPRPDQREPSREEARSCSCDQQHARSCPGYPLPPSFASFLSLKPRETPSSRTKAPKPDRNCLPKDPGAGSVDPGLGLALGMSLEGPAHDPDCPYVPDPGQQLPKRQGQDPARDGGPQQAPSLPCLCFQTCAQFLCQSQAPPADSGLPAPAQSPGPFPCFSCQRSFPTCAQLLRHQQSHGLQEGASQHLCMHCAAAFARPALLLQHQRERHAAEPRGFLCPECGRAFNSHGNLRIHLNVHTGARPYSCADCGKSFSQSGALRVHRRIHTGERPYVCAYCARGFSNLAGLRAHERTHTGEKPYPCPQCGKCFTQSGALKIHTRIHTGERPFVCGHCGKAFSSHSGIRFHHRTVHGAIPKLSITVGLSPCSTPTTGSSAGPGSDTSLGGPGGPNSNVSSPASMYSSANACSGGPHPKSPGLDAAAASSSSSSFPGPASPPRPSADLRAGGEAAPKLGADPAVSGLDLSRGSAGREQRARPYDGAGRGAARRGPHRAPEQQRGRAGALREKEAGERDGTGGLTH
ncbi:zinc finger protein 497-like [Anguilla rostrata]|uniref:zinc finger protein 497-like n=1 Tax=Anguilla rostrata TaxID=7938 RepID=UPI0030CDEC6B